MVYPHDDHKDSRHFGVFVNNELVGIGSIYHESQKGRLEKGEWRLRGMAVEPAHKGKGLGGELLKHMIEYVRSVRGDLLWCNGRTSACAFYEHYGFIKWGREFEVPGIGPHYVMVLEV